MTPRPIVSDEHPRYKREVALTGVLYLHRISDQRLSGSTLKSYDVFWSMCGEHAAKSVILVTTMWSQANKDKGLLREDELKNKYWKPMLDLGSRIMRFEGSHQSAWIIVDAVVGR